MYVHRLGKLHTTLYYTRRYLASILIICFLALQLNIHKWRSRTSKLLWNDWARRNKVSNASQVRWGREYLGWDIWNVQVGAIARWACHSRISIKHDDRYNHLGFCLLRPRLSSPSKAIVPNQIATNTQDRFSFIAFFLWYQTHNPYT